MKLAASRALRRTVKIALFAGTLVLGLAGGILAGSTSVVLADDEAPVQAGSVLLARSDCELQKVVIARGSRVEVTSATSSSANIALPDGHVLKAVPMSRIRYFFDVVR